MSLRQRVVAAIQSPTLLNRLATSSAWQLEVADLGDASMKEVALLQAPPWDGSQEGVVAVLICSPDHRYFAERRFPGVPLVWVHHTGVRGYPADVNTGEMGITFSNSLAMQWAKPGHRVAVVRPTYLALARWRWRPGVTWTMRSRPKGRYLETMNRLAGLVSRAPSGAHTLYGEDTPGGFLGTSGREALLEHCSAYVSALPRWVGFGLAEHEAFAAGCPVVGGRWGDVAAEMADEYTALTDDDVAMGEALQRVLRDEAYANELSTMGLDMTARCRTPLRMRRDIEAFLSRLTTGG